MNKSRIEAFSDGVFAIAMTLLAFDIKVPIASTGTEGELVGALAALTPLFVIYMVTFLVLSFMWINHHFIFHFFAHQVNRQLNLLNMLYLMFVVLMPFSADLMSTHINTKAAVIFYGLNIFIIALLSAAMTFYIRSSKELLNPELSLRTINQSKFRTMISLIFYPLGMLFSFLWIPASIFFYAFPVLFNIIPGTVDFLERHSPLNFG